MFQLQELEQQIEARPVGSRCCVLHPVCGLRAQVMQFYAVAMCMCFYHSLGAHMIVLTYINIIYIYD